MNTILLVEDEFPARELVKSMLDWDEAGFTVAWEARNGAEALALYEAHRPDLIISDIQMPVMDGLELLREIRRRDGREPFIVLSCYERFDYARQVLRLGGLDYLIKDTLTPETLYAALCRARERLSPPAPPVPVRAPAPAAAPLSAPLAAWLASPGPAETAALAGALGEGNYLMLAADFSPQRAEDAPAAELKAALSLAEGFSGRGGFCPDAAGALVLLCPLSAAPGEDGRAARYSLLCGVKAALERCAGVPVTLGVSAVHSGAGALSQALGECTDTLRGRLFLGCGSILYFNPLTNAAYAVQQRRLEQLVQNLRRALTLGDLPGVQRELARLYAAELSGVMHLNYLDYLNTLLWGILTTERMIRAFSGPPPGTGGSPDLAAISAMERPEDMAGAFSALFAALLAPPHQAPEPPYSRRVREIAAYIDSCLAEELTLESIAEKFQIHKTHLARVFKEETGVSIHEFIRRRRIEAAKVLLADSRCRINEIVYLVGFNSPQNFYTLFTRYVGLTPKAFREQYG